MRGTSAYPGHYPVPFQALSVLGLGFRFLSHLNSRVLAPLVSPAVRCIYSSHQNHSTFSLFKHAYNIRFPRHPALLRQLPTQTVRK